MPEHHGLDIAAVLLLLAKEIGAASIRRKLELRQDDDGIDTPDDDDDAVAAPAPAPTTTDPATATTSAAPTSTASPGRQLDKGSKAGIAIGVIVLVVFLGGVVFMYWRHRRGRRWGRRNKDHNNNNHNSNNNNDNYNSQYPNQPNMTMAAHNLARKSVSDSSPPLGSISPPSTNPDAGRPWFDNGHGSSELPSHEARDSDGVAGWVYDKAELGAPEAGSAQAPGQLHPHHQYHQYSNSTELPTAGNQIHEIPEASACSYAPVELPAAVPDHTRYSGFTGFSGGEGEDIGRNVSTRTSNTDGSANRRESLAPTFTVSSPATTVAETVSDSGYGNHLGQVSPASPYARSAAGGNTM